MKHPHYDVIVAWAAGETIEWRRPGGTEWTKLTPYNGNDYGVPSFWMTFEYRIKPKDPEYKLVQRKSDGALLVLVRNSNRSVEKNHLDYYKVEGNKVSDVTDWLPLPDTYKTT